MNKLFYFSLLVPMFYCVSSYPEQKFIHNDKAIETLEREMDSPEEFSDFLEKSFENHFLPLFNAVEETENVKHRQETVKVLNSYFDFLLNKLQQLNQDYYNNKTINREILVDKSTGTKEGQEEMAPMGQDEPDYDTDRE